MWKFRTAGQQNCPWWVKTRRLVLSVLLLSWLTVRTRGMWKCSTPSKPSGSFFPQFNFTHIHTVSDGEAEALRAVRDSHLHQAWGRFFSSCARGCPVSTRRTSITSSVHSNESPCVQSKSEENICRVRVHSEHQGTTYKQELVENRSWRPLGCFSCPVHSVRNVHIKILHLCLQLFNSLPVGKNTHRSLSQYEISHFWVVCLTVIFFFVLLMFTDSVPELWFFDPAWLP